MSLFGAQLKDTSLESLVTGGVARLWPPLVSAAPSAAGVSGKVTVLNGANGHQVTYNGHPLYTFVSDRPGQVLVHGQGHSGGHAPGDRAHK